MMKASTIAYAMYLIFSVMISLTLSAIPAILLFAIIVQNFTIFLNTIWPFSLIHNFVITTFSEWIPAFALQYWWLLILFVPLALISYGVFLAFLFGFFKISRRGIPHLEDGHYSRESEAWLIHEFYQVYYRLYPYFAGIFSMFLKIRALHTLFGARIGRNSVVGNAVLMNPERTIVGDNTFLGYGSVLTGHVYEDEGLYLKEARIGNNVTVGGYAIIFPGAVIGDNVIIGANTVVPKDGRVPDNTIWVHGKAIPRRPGSKAERLHKPIGGPPVMDIEDEQRKKTNNSVKKT
jgi:acetyltransferase-like isoleucine patch superfamily enzyme